MSNQFTQLEPPTAYPVNLTLPQYKLFQRLGTIDYPSMIMLFTNNQG
jgi:hypothetical protein